LPYNNLEAVRELFEREGEEFAALILEPVGGNMGCVPPIDGYLEGLRELTERYGIVLIFDEVMTGFRLARGGAQELYGVTPDMTCLGKIIGGGLPVGAYGGKREIVELIAPSGPIYQAGTLSGNPLAMAAGLATLKAVSEPGFHEGLDALGKRWREGMNEAASAGDRPFSINLSDTDAFKDFFWHMLSRGVYLAPSQYEAGFISAAHTQGDLDLTFEAAAEWFAGRA
jgi:glutamate-1-semialdehyde 2,1-aminomutase